MFKHIFCIIILGGYIMGNLSVVECSDYANERYRRIGELKEASEFYKKTAGKNPTYCNLMKSLEIKDALGNDASEVEFAIEILILKGMKTKKYRRR